METQLHQDFRYRRIAEPVPLNRAHELLVESDDGTTCLHLAATCGGFEFIPTDLLNMENLLRRDKRGDTPIHLAAFTGRLKELPLSSMDASILEQMDGDATTVIDIAKRKGHLDQIPTNLLYTLPLYQMEMVVSLLRKCHIAEIPSELLSPNLWATTSEKLHDCGTLFHEAARFGVLDLLPDEILDTDCWTLRDKFGRTPIHIVAQMGPPGSLAKIIARTGGGIQWDIMDEYRNTVLHSAAMGGQLATVPSQLFTEERLTQCNTTKMNIADLAYRHKCIGAIPKDLRILSEDYLRERLRHALTTGDGDGIPSAHFSKKSFDRLLPAVLGNSSGLQLAHRHKTYHLLEPDLLSEIAQDAIAGSGTNPLHSAASIGILNRIPRNLLTQELLLRLDESGQSPIHIAISRGFLWQIPEDILNPDLLSSPNAHGVTGYHLLAAYSDFGSIPAEWFTPHVLLLRDNTKRSVADVIWENGHTEKLSVELRDLSGLALLSKFTTSLQNDYPEAAQLLHNCDETLLNYSELAEIMRCFVREWSTKQSDLSLDKEQADAVAEYGPHIQVTARAGSGKTRTLVARALFLITHCKIPASSILILAFNKKAVNEIRERLGKILNQDQMPHILTFHALAHRIVRPEEELIFDEGETKEGQIFSATIQRIIDEQMRGGSFEYKLRELMQARWLGDLVRIISQGFNLKQEEFLELRSTQHLVTMNGRRVKTEEHKNIANALLRLGMNYSYHRAVHRSAAEVYTPDFYHYHKDTHQLVLIEVLGEENFEANAARKAYLQSERSSESRLLQFSLEEFQDPEEALQRLVGKLADCGISVSPMSDDQLWLLLRDDIIRDFTKTVRGFISRCQKELISPDQLDSMLPESDPPLWETVWKKNKPIKMVHVPGLQARFWRMCSEVHRRYLKVLEDSHKIDFDQLMRAAAELIRDGRIGFKSARGSGNIREIRHVLIDEFQDFSHLFNELRKSIVAQSPEAHFFCVGDDWQAINKFAGSDLRYFTSFGEIFVPSVRKLITCNYRSNFTIVDAGNLVMSERGEPSICSSSEKGNVWRVESSQFLNLTEAEEAVIGELGDYSLAVLRIAYDCTSRGETLAVLTRFNTVATSDGMFQLANWQKHLQSFLPEKQRDHLMVSTTHGFKGKEADVVILLDPEQYPFIHPDMIFSTIFGDTYQSINDDERRLFYVGVTRPRKTLFLLSTLEKSQEIRFMPGFQSIWFDINCLKTHLLCGNRVIVRLKNLTEAYGGGGTYQLKDKLKQFGFKSNQNGKVWTWSKFLEKGSINSPLECVQYLSSQPWIKEADGIIASFAWEEQRHQFSIVKGQITKGSAALAVQQLPSNGDSPSILRVTPKPYVPPAPVAPISQKNVPKISAERPKTNTATTQYIFETSVVGMQYSGRRQIAGQIIAGEFIKLQREPDNKHDSNAIKVMTSQGQQIGYINRRIASHMAKGLDAWGGSWNARVRAVFYQPPPHTHASVKICFPLPPGVTIPDDLCSSDQVEDNPFGSAISKEGKQIQNYTIVDNTAPLVDTTQEPGAPAVQNAASQIIDSDNNLHAIDWGALSPHQRELLENLMEPRLAPIIAELYLDGCSDWPEIGYEGRDATGRCTGTMLEVAWLDFRIGITIPGNDFESFEASGWKILPAASVTTKQLKDFFTNYNSHVRNSEAHASSFCNSGEAVYQAQASSNEFIDIIKRIRNGQFLDDDPDDDITF